MADAETAVIAPNVSAREGMLILGPIWFGWHVEICVSMIAIFLLVQYSQGERFKRDRGDVKVAVWATLVLTAAISFLYSWCEIAWIVEPKRDFDTLYGVKLVDCVVIIPTLLQAAVVQTYLARRATALVQLRWLRYALSGVLYALVASTFVSTCLFAASMFLWWIDVNTPPPWGWDFSIRLFLAFTATTDVAIAITFATTLRSKVAGFNQRTDQMLRSLSVVSLQTGGITALVALAGAISSAAAPIDGTYDSVLYAFLYSLPAFYALSLVANLNARDKAAAKSFGASGQVAEFSVGPSMASGGKNSSTVDSGIAVMVQSQDKGSYTV